MEYDLLYIASEIDLLVKVVLMALVASVLLNSVPKVRIL